MDQKGASHDPLGRRNLNPWRQYEPLPADVTQADGTLLSFKERIETMSTIEATRTWKNTEGHLDPPPRPQDGRPEGDARTQWRLERARMSPWWWMPEILSQLGAVFCLAAIIILLWWCDGKPPPNMGLGITLNTVLAFLTSLTKVAFMVPIIEGLGQLKWMWFLSRQHRPLMDFQVFEEATRGGLGGAKLLFSFKG
ncbi:hypothetical protein QBC39DRAFT_353569 [Podospora conica]|nr:hypothetical protein QBC39DRAFT_353569 [Schizothecium conicum]